jgi:hypothetical protein
MRRDKTGVNLFIPKLPQDEAAITRAKRSLLIKGFCLRLGAVGIGRCYRRRLAYFLCPSRLHRQCSTKPEAEPDIGKPTVTVANRAMLRV